MEFHEAKILGDKWVHRLMRELGLPHWQIEVEYRNIAESALATCKAYTDYEKAHITIDPHKIDDEKTFVEVLTHELLHVMHSPYILIEEALQDVLADNPEASAAFCQMFRSAAERTVKNLERITYEMPAMQEIRAKI